MATLVRRLASLLLVALAASCGPRASAPALPSTPPEESVRIDIPEEVRTPRPFDVPVDDGEGAVPLRFAPTLDEALPFEGPLEWLARHQSRDGSWSSFAFGAWCPGTRCPGPSAENETVGVTGLALMAYLNHGDTHKTGSHSIVVGNGLKFLKSVQGPDGEFARPWSSHPGLQNAWATLAMAEAYGMTQSKLFRESAEKAVQALRSSQLPRGGWRKEARGEEPDLETTAWSVMALRSAQVIELGVDRADFERTLGWLDAVTDPETGCVGADRRLEAETAMATVARMFCGNALGRSGDPLFEKGSEIVSRHPPAWDPSPGAMDARSWYFGTLSCFIRKGSRFRRPKSPQTDRSDRWSDGLVALLKAVPWERSGCLRGSFAPCEPWGREHGRVATTAMAAILESFYY